LLPCVGFSSAEAARTPAARTDEDGGTVLETGGAEVVLQAVNPATRSTPVARPIWECIFIFFIWFCARLARFSDSYALWAYREEGSTAEQKTGCNHPVKGVMSSSAQKYQNICAPRHEF
jgi:hypothetical protein